MPSVGGKRTGAGRKRGSKTAKTRNVAIELHANGITPLEYMLSVMRNEANPQTERMDAAKGAAPYMHPRLNTIEANVNVIQRHEQAIQMMAAIAAGQNEEAPIVSPTLQ